jgi:hypothetical protein
MQERTLRRPHRRGSPLAGQSLLSPYQRWSQCVAPHRCQFHEWTGNLQANSRDMAGLEALGVEGSCTQGVAACTLLCTTGGAAGAAGGPGERDCDLSHGRASAGPGAAAHPHSPAKPARGPRKGRLYAALTAVVRTLEGVLPLVLRPYLLAALGFHCKGLPSERMPQCVQCQWSMMT